MAKAAIDGKDEVLHGYGSRVVTNSDLLFRTDTLTIDVLTGALPATTALSATQTDVQTMAVDTLQLESTPKSVEALFSALDSPSAELRDAARFSLEFQLSQNFPNASAARSWWEANRSKFDQDLAPKP